MSVQASDFKNKCSVPFFIDSSGIVLYVTDMSRVARIVVPGFPYHVTQRGNRREPVFFCDADRLTFLRLLRLYAPRYDLDVLAYCLMPNHVHLVVVPQKSDALAGTFRPVHSLYAQHVNETQGLTGLLWQGRFFSCALDAIHLCRAVRYVERNPVRARLVEHAVAYLWSSARAHCGMRAQSFLSDISPFMNIGDWAAWLDEDQDAREIEALRKHTRTGRPLGDNDFLTALETRLGQPVRPHKRGPKKRQRA